MLATFTKPINGIPLALTCDAALETPAKFMLNLLADEQRNRNILQNDYKMQIGWTLYFLEARGHGYVLTAPDYGRNPLMDRTTDLTTALAVQMRQNDILRQTGTGGAAVSFQDTLITLKGALTAGHIYMVRDKTQRKDDSGWYVGLMNDEIEKHPAADYSVLYTWQLLAARPGLLPLLALPYGCVAILESNKIVEIVDAENRKLMTTL